MVGQGCLLGDAYISENVCLAVTTQHPRLGCGETIFGVQPWDPRPVPSRSTAVLALVCSIYQRQNTAHVDTIQNKKEIASLKGLDTHYGDEYFEVRFPLKTFF